MGTGTKKPSRMFRDCLTAETDHQWGAWWPGPWGLGNQESLSSVLTLTLTLHSSADIKRSSLRALWRDRTKQ